MERNLPGEGTKPKRRLRSRAKYQKGDKITSLDELMAQDLVYCFDKITPRGWFQAWQMRLANQYVQMGVLFKAVRKEAADVPRKKEDNGA